MATAWEYFPEIGVPGINRTPYPPAAVTYEAALFFKSAEFRVGFFVFRSTL